MSNRNSLVFHESTGAKPNGFRFQLDPNGICSTQTHPINSVYSIKAFLKTVFLPENFPSSVSDDYISYQIWDTIQAFCSSISGALAARAIFESIGVGDESATVYGATFTWLIKDGTGMTGRILFAWYQGSFLDSNSKMWRLYADILNDFSFLVDLITPLVDKAFTIYFLSFAGLLRSIVGIAGGATRSALTQHQAINNNLADVSAKDSSQETLVNLVALVFNIFLLTFVKDSKFTIWLLFFVFVIGHIFANYKAVRSVVMKTVNRNRFHILAKHFLGSNETLRPKEVNNLEPVFHPCVRYFNLKLGCQIKQLPMSSSHSLDSLAAKFNSQKFLLMFDMKKRDACVLLHESSSDKDLLRAVFQIEFVESRLKKDVDLEQVLAQADSVFDAFVQGALDRGWSFAYTQLSPSVYRYSLDRDIKQA